jgi:hypothetical protein
LYLLLCCCRRFFSRRPRCIGSPKTTFAAPVAKTGKYGTSYLVPHIFVSRKSHEYGYPVPNCFFFAIPVKQSWYEYPAPCLHFSSPALLCSAPHPYMPPCARSNLLKPSPAASSHVKSCQAKPRPVLSSQAKPSQVLPCPIQFPSCRPAGTSSVAQPSLPVQSSQVKTGTYRRGSEKPTQKRPPGKCLPFFILKLLLK